jgi:hypothetical protein
VIKSQTKAKTISLERASLDPLRQGQRLNKTVKKCSKLPTPQSEAKGPKPSAKEQSTKQTQATQRAPKA